MRGYISLKYSKEQELNEVAGEIWGIMSTLGIERRDQPEKTKKQKESWE